ncbi:hypothetical protein [Microvirga subterranea]|uniref:Uncharacterized protein n=1 Tax=Microvirga subterranea TaxID=186651 RepID=A0A370HSI3_9HYPH|nr:hypothetical protein [Microvirga subterranea]RDI61260.1 hypothetical protein DES45_102655 [Microvirga subterranea]
MQYMGNIDAEAGGAELSHSVAGSDYGGEARQALLILDGIDVQHGRELTALEQSGAEEELKEFIRSDIIARYHARRAPFVRFLEERQQPEKPLIT